MTRLTRSLRREVRDIRRGDLVITLTEAGILIRYKGKRTTYGPISYSLVMFQGEKQMAEAIRKERQERKQLRKGGR